MNDEYYKLKYLKYKEKYTQLAGSYDKRIIDAANKKIIQCGNIPRKNPHHGLYTQYINEAPSYPFKLSVNESTSLDYHTGSIKIQIKTNKKQNNLPGVLSLQEFLQRRIGHKPSIDELGEFISLYTIHHQRKLNNEYSSSPSETDESVETVNENQQLTKKEITEIQAIVEAQQKSKIDKPMNTEGCQADSDDDWDTLID